MRAMAWGLALADGSGELFTGRSVSGKHTGGPADHGLVSGVRLRDAWGRHQDPVGEG